MKYEPTPFNLGPFYLARQLSLSFLVLELELMVFFVELDFGFHLLFLQDFEGTNAFFHLCR